jgi:hypothetical protein
MEVSPQMIERVLEHLVSPKWDGIMEYDTTIDMHDDTYDVYYIIDVMFDIETYWKTYHSGDYDYPGEMNDEIEDDVRNAMKYLGINKVIVEIYVTNED